MSLIAFLHSVLDIWAELVVWVCAFFVIFGALSHIVPCNPGQKIIRQGMLTDLIYFLLMPILNRLVRIVFVGAGIYLFFGKETQESLQGYLLNGFGVLSTMAIWQQSAIIFLLSDFILYWTHRWFHQKSMWPFHAIHHSSEQVDWLSTFRFHPINTWLSFTLVDSVMLIIGFSPAAVGLMGGFNLMYSAMVHANLNWSFGPFKYLFASPVYHRWHHTTQEEGMNKNFAPTFPIIDVLFGTFYMPDNKVPERYGVSGEVLPRSFYGQMIWPFHEIAKRK